MIGFAVTKWLRSRKYFFLALCCISGCTLSLPQVDSAVGFMRSLSSSSEKKLIEKPPLWMASVGSIGAVLRPYEANGLVVFANSYGDAIAFDGWHVRSIIGFDLPTPITISREGELKTLSINQTKNVTRCEMWVLDGLTWTQACGDGSGHITLNKSGNIEEISMSLGRKYGDVRLVLAK